MGSKKQSKKHLDGRCFFCGEVSYTVLDLHRIIPGEVGGRYDSTNTLTLCANCHRRVHGGEIVIDRKYQAMGTRALWVLHCWVGGVEYWWPYRR